MIIPAIVGIILIAIFGVASSTISTTAMSNPTQIVTLMFSTSFIAIAITLIFVIFFVLLATIAMGRLAETGSFGSIFEFKEIYETIAEKIGWTNYLVWAILFFYIAALIGIISLLINVIPGIGTIVFFLTIPGFLIIFKSRAIGLIYNNSKE
jgi:hypothetical protein